MEDRNIFCANWDSSEEKYVVGKHGEVSKVVLDDAYFVAGEISRGMPDDQYLHERDVEKVNFEIDISGNKITADDVSSPSKSYLKKFPGVYKGVAHYVRNLDRIPVGRFICPDCSNNVEFKENINNL